jgi:hypothetical protein
MRAPAEHVLDALTDPELCSRWSPIDFEVEELDGDRLVAGGRARIAGRLAGARVCFDIEVFEGGPERLVLSAACSSRPRVGCLPAVRSRAPWRGSRARSRRPAGKRPHSRREPDNEQ